MKSTVKIAYQARFTGGMPGIKIVQPISVLNPSPEEDVDPRDEMVNQFLHQPLSTERTFLWELSSHYPSPFDNPTHEITHIEAVTNDRLMWKLENVLLNTLENWGVDFPREKLESFFREVNEAVESSNRKKYEDSSEIRKALYAEQKIEK